jgi:hypothetical protein
MADYGIEVYNKAGQLVFTPLTNAGRLIYSGGSNVSNSWNLPGLLEGVPFVGWLFSATQYPRPVSWSISGTTFNLNLPITGLNTMQRNNVVNFIVGIR